jgi:hypothetical protein
MRESKKGTKFLMQFAVEVKFTGKRQFPHTRVSHEAAALAADGILNFIFMRCFRAKKSI